MYIVDILKNLIVLQRLSLFIVNFSSEGHFSIILELCLFPRAGFSLFHPFFLRSGGRLVFGVMGIFGIEVLMLFYQRLF